MATTSIPHGWKYDIFVSFRGEDIRKSFIDHLFDNFNQKGIYAFRDDKEMPKGEEISHHLYKAIKESRFLMVIFSKDYASSSWCLRELVKILECKQIETPKREIRIIFYDVKPDVVRNQTGSYAEAFAKHELLNSTKVNKWKEALSMAAGLSGGDLQDMTNGYESKFINRISKEILQKLCDGPLHVGDYLVGIDFHFDQLELSRFVGSDKVNMIGICGVSGIGKTTLAKAIYNLMYIQFEGSCFCEDVQGVKTRQGLMQVQMQMIGKILKSEDLKISSLGEGTMVIKNRMAYKRILLVLDDVNNLEQLEALAGSSDWFFPGSLIVFTSKDKQLLRSHKMDEIYEMETLEDKEALELFSFYAFGKMEAKEDFKELASQVIIHLQGHPLHLKIFGRLLYEQPVHVWKNELDRLQTYLKSDILQKLRLKDSVKEFLIPDYILSRRAHVGKQSRIPACPVIVFVNSRSGEQLGGELLVSYRTLLNKNQVFDLKEKAPDKVLHQLFLNVEKLKREGDSLASEIQKKLRIIVAGGDGTAGWILGVISDLNLAPPPPVATVPLGTENNLSFAFGWVRWGRQICGS